MAGFMPEDLEKIRKRVLAEGSLKEGGKRVRITVHLGTCGIAAGGDAVYEALKHEITSSGRDDIEVLVSGCAGMCSSEPNITVKIINEDAILYRDVNAEKMHKIFEGHVMNGEIQTSHALARIKQSDQEGEDPYAG